MRTLNIKKIQNNIQTLRALSVLCVVFYHAKLVLFNKILFQGGYIGVDIFFVISGYLITKIIFELNLKKNFRIKIFYFKRFKRIFPALAVALVLFSVLVYLFQKPQYIIDSSKQILTSVFFISNFYFYLTDVSYGDASSLIRPFLHTWSLSIEAQFYIFYPFFLIILNKFNLSKNSYLFIYICLFILFFSISWLLSSKFTNFSFYNPALRYFEFLLGGCIFFIKKREHFLFSFCGLSIILFSLIFFDETKLNSLELRIIPILGTALILLNNLSKNNFLSNVFSNSKVIYIGNISYSFYIYHFPIFSFAFISGFLDLDYDQSDNIKKIILILLSFICASLSFKFIEKPIRKINKPNLNFFKIYFFITIFVLIIPLIYIGTKGFIKQYPKLIQEALLTSAPWYDLRQNFRSCFDRKKNFCSFNKKKEKKIILVGSSHAAHLSLLLKNEIEKQQLNYNFITTAGPAQYCNVIPKKEFLNFYKSGKAKCNEPNFETSNIIYNNKNSIIIYNGLNTNSTSKEEILLIKKSFKFLLDSGYKIIFSFPHPMINNFDLTYYIKDNFKIFKKKDNDFVESHIENLELSFSQDIFFDNEKFIFENFEEIKHKNFYKLYPHNYFCNLKNHNKCRVFFKTKLLYLDDIHYSNYIAKQVSDEILNIVKNFKD